MSISFTPLQSAITNATNQVSTSLTEVANATSSMQIVKTSQLQWRMAVLQQVLTASSNVIEGCLSVVKGALGNINR